MEAKNQSDLTARVEQLERRLDATLNAVGKLVKALDHMRDNDARFIFEMDLVKHCLNEAGCSEYRDSAASKPQ